MARIRSGTATQLVAIVSLVINFATFLVLLFSVISATYFHTTIMDIVYGSKMMEEGEEVLILLTLVGAVFAIFTTLASLLLLLERPNTAPSTHHLGPWLASHGATIFLYTVSAIIISFTATKVSSNCTPIVATLGLLSCINLVFCLVVHHHRWEQVQARGARLEHLASDFT